MNKQEHRPGIGALALAALGVVFGDIGTSPLYAFKEAFVGAHGMSPTVPDVLAVLSTLLWSLTLLVSIKYVWLILKFDNDGEGGVLALTAFAHRLSRGKTAWSQRLIALGVFAAALFYGDAIITPAISVLSALEGVRIATPNLEHAIVPLTVIILIVLFAIQKQGSARVGRWFGPITLGWFLTLAVLGSLSIVRTPQILAAVNPLYAIKFALAHPGSAFILLSAVFLTLTGGEALYADMGHFGASPIRRAWYWLVWPSLLLNYFGQGALVVRQPEAAANPFYYLAPDWFTLPLVVLATCATVIASQATISGAYSMTLQASRLGYLPRLRILHTSDTERGQIYIPSVNWLMLVGVILLVFVFGSSSALAAAYGIAVSGTMVITTVLSAAVVLMLPGARRTGVLLLLGVFGALELLFLASNLTKILSGGWFPLAFGFGLFTLLMTWARGSQLIATRRRENDVPLLEFCRAPPEVPRVAGHAVFLTADLMTVPSALFHCLKHFKTVHQQITFLHVVTADVPRIKDAERMTYRVLAPAIASLEVRYGFREEPSLADALQHGHRVGFNFEPMATSFFVARTTVVDGPGGMPAWQCAVFAWMSRQAESAAGYYQLPPNSVVELGTQVIL